MTGRKPAPTALKLLRGGDKNKNRTNLEEPQPTVTPNPDPPDWLDEEAKQEWLRLAPMLGRLGVLTETDAQALAGYCETWATWKTATQKLRQFGMVIKVKEGDLPVISPYVKIAHNATVQMRAYLVEFGMTPSSRARVHATKQPEKAVSKWAGLLK
jgi:P27 family predicted phage terminase small subunit